MTLADQALDADYKIDGTVVGHYLRYKGLSPETEKNAYLQDNQELQSNLQGIRYTANGSYEETRKVKARYSTTINGKIGNTTRTLLSPKIRLCGEICKNIATFTKLNHSFYVSRPIAPSSRKSRCSVGYQLFSRIPENRNAKTPRVL